MGLSPFRVSVFINKQTLYSTGWKTPLCRTLKGTVSHRLICIAKTTDKLCTSSSYSGGGGDRDGRDLFCADPSSSRWSLIKAQRGWRLRDFLLWRLSGERAVITGYVSATWKIDCTHTHRCIENDDKVVTKGNNIKLAVWESTDSIQNFKHKVYVIQAKKHGTR